MTEMMKAAIFVEPGKMAVEEVPKATLEQDDDIVIRVVRTCVCGSDLWFFRGLSGQAAHSQVGHESIGVVEEVGAAVESVKPGDFVVGKRHLKYIFNARAADLGRHGQRNIAYAVLPVENTRHGQN